MFNVLFICTLYSIVYKCSCALLLLCTRARRGRGLIDLLLSASSLVVVVRFDSETFRALHLTFEPRHKKTSLRTF